MVHRAKPSGMGSSWTERCEPADAAEATEEAADGFRLATAVDFPVEARDADDLADEGLLDDCAGAAGAEDELSTGGALLGTGFVALLEVLTVDGAGVVGVRPGTGFSLRLLTFCC